MKRQAAKPKKFDRSLVFYIVMLAFPVLQFCVFYVAVNFNSILMSFRYNNISTGETVWTAEYMRRAFKMLFSATEDLPYKIGMSVLSSFVYLAVSIPLALLFSYYIYKKMFAGAFFRVILFMPSILSSLVLVSIYMFFVERGVPEIVRLMGGKTIEGLIQNKNTRYLMIMFFCIWASFGPNMLMYSNAMSGISPEIVDSAKVDGATRLREFFSITLPLIYPTLTTFVVVGVAGIFTNQFNLFNFYGAYAPERLQTLGYYLYKETQLNNLSGSPGAFSYLSSLGLIITVVAVSLTAGVRKLMERFGPSVE